MQMFLVIFKVLYNVCCHDNYLAITHIVVHNYLTALEFAFRIPLQLVLGGVRIVALFINSQEQTQ